MGDKTSTQTGTATNSTQTIVSDQNDITGGMSVGASTSGYTEGGSTSTSIGGSFAEGSLQETNNVSNVTYQTNNPPADPLSEEALLLAATGGASSPLANPGGSPPSDSSSSGDTTDTTGGLKSVPLWVWIIGGAILLVAVRK